MEKYSDKEIIEALRDRNNKIIAYIYRRYMPMIRKMVRDSGEYEIHHEDIFQEGIYVLLCNLSKPDFKIKYKFKTYFYAICLKQLHLLQRKKTPEKNYFRKRILDEETFSISESIDIELIDKAFKNAFDELGNMCKTILKLYWREINLREIANIMSVEYSKVRKRKRECENTLSTKIKSNPIIRCILKNVDVPANAK